MSERTLLRSEPEATVPNFAPDAGDVWLTRPNVINVRSLRSGVEVEAAPLPTTGIHPAVVTISLSAVAWFLAVAWLNFAGGPETDLALAVVTGIFVMYFTLFLLTASMAIGDRRWRQEKASFADFLNDDVPVDSGTLRGREVLVQIALLPMSLAVGGTMIGLIWSMVRWGW